MHNVLELKDKHRDMAIKYTSGVTVKEIAKEHGTTTQYIYTLMNDPLFQREVARIRKSMEKQAIARWGKVLDDVFAKADTIVAQQIKLALHAKSESVRRGACSDLTNLMKVSVEAKDTGSKLIQLRMSQFNTVKEDELHEQTG